jgi:hypothetical protein
VLDQDFFAPWLRRWTEDGVVFTPRRDETRGSIRVRHNQPLQSMRSLAFQAAGLSSAPSEGESVLLHKLLDCGDAVSRVEEAGMQLDDLHVRATDEGEHCAWVALSAAESSRCIGVIYGDRHMSIVDAAYTRGSGSDPFRRFVESVTTAFPLRLGWRRARRFAFAPPPGWRVLSCDLTTRFESPDGSVRITVPAATPFGSDSIEERFFHDDVRVGFRPSGPLAQEHVGLPSGLRGETVQGAGSGRDDPESSWVYGAAVTDDRFRYMVRCAARRASTDEKPCKALVRGLLESIRPIPRQRECHGHRLAAQVLFDGYKA